MTIPFEGQIRRRDFLLVRRALLPWGWRFAPLLTLGILVLVSIPGGAYRVFLDRPLYYLAHIPVGLVLLAGSLTIPTLIVQSSWAANRAIKGRVSGVVEAEALEWHSSSLDIRYPWEDLAWIRDIKGIPCMLTRSGELLLLPANLFATEEAAQKARNQIAEKLRAV